MSLRGRILVRLGHFDEASRCFDQMLEIEPGLIDPTVQFIAHLGYVDLAWCLDDIAMADEHARRVAELAIRQNSGYLRAYSLSCSGAAHAIAGQYQAAIQSFTAGVIFLREARVAMEIEPEMLASIADCHLRSGAFDRAIENAHEAIAVSRARSARLPQCRASITLASALVAIHNGALRDEASTLLDTAETLIDVTGATIYQRLLDEARKKCAIQVN